ncbi:DNA polymerase III epsilon subunit [hydrothermal vent metagenome]|uniref:DNA polymerase III subunit epsilon n=1 Tax=hydrothermal vent metagenome TaxID=652676 RepID=A0A3B0UQD6_9ZZZZ
MHREIVLDTETTGLSAQNGDRIVEIGCVELINHIPSGNHYHTYVNPERDMPEGAFRVHGLSEQFLADKPLFTTIAQQFADFIADSTLIIHNAPFDIGFLNAELKRSGRPQLANPVIDTVQLARKKHPGARVGLDALCKHYNIDNSHRTLHGALLDSEILAEVYLELIGGRQVTLSLSANEQPTVTRAQKTVHTSYSSRLRPLVSPLSPEQEKAHDELVKSLGEQAIWLDY